MPVFKDTLLLIGKVLGHILQSLLQWIRKPGEKLVANEICLITGTASGLGRLLALEFAKRGATLVLWDIHTEGNAETAVEVRKMGVEVHVYTCDVSQKEAIYETAQRVKMEVGDVTILVNGACVGARKPFLQCPDELLERTMRVNCHAHFWTVKSFLPKMIEMNHGHIVTIANYLGLIAVAGVEDYCASKFAAIGFHESLSHGLRAKGVDGVKTTLVCAYTTHASIASRHKIRKELEPFVSPLKPEHCVQAAMNAILTNQTMVCIPRVLYLVAFCKQIMPWECQVISHKFIGAHEGLHRLGSYRQ